MTFHRRRRLHSLAAAGTMAVVLAATAAPRSARADNDTLHGIAALIAGVGGYYFTSGSAMQALGNPKFGSTTSLFIRPKIRGPLTLTGGVQLIGAGDHWQPFAGGNSLSLTGPAVRVQQIPRMNRVAPFVSAGFFYGSLQSYNQNLSAYRWVPSADLGVEYRFARYLGLTASYRVTGSFGGVNTSGASIGIKVF